ncbi:MAG: alpha/beta hydrolase [Candidatus Eisenbacteria bacterium]
MDSLASRILFVHGYPLDRRLWDGQYALADGWSVRMMDLPGFGARPPFPEAPEDLTLTHYADAVRDEIREWGDEPVVLAALSMGGYIALECWRRFPEKIAGLILCDTRAEADSPEGQKGRLAAVEKVRTGQADAMFEQMSKDLIAPSRRGDDDFRARVLEMMRGADSVGVQQALFAMRNRDDYRAELGGITVPTLVVVGELDALTPPEGAKSMAEQIPGARLAVIPDAGHLSPMERPEACNEAIRGFLEG